MLPNAPERGQAGAVNLALSQRRNSDSDRLSGSPHTPHTPRAAG